MDSSKRALLIDAEAGPGNVFSRVLREKGYYVIASKSAAEAIRLISEKKFDLVVASVEMAGKGAFQLHKEVNLRAPDSSSWIFVTQTRTPELVEQAAKVGVFEVLPRSASSETIAASVGKFIGKDVSPLRKIMDVIQAITGVQLGREKELLIETRLYRRMRLLSMNSIEEYMTYFHGNRESEIDELVSLMTTHTTEFFREAGHFDYLYEEVFPHWVRAGKPVTIWSAACSTGQELYSLAMAWFEYLSENKVQRPPRVTFIGTDIDVASVEKAREGIYPIEEINRIEKNLAKKYFEFGEGELAHLARIADKVHSVCRFETGNLLSKEDKVKNVDLIFLRNVLIYFKPEDVASIAHKMGRALNADGFLVLGHSESLAGLETPFKSVGNAVYRQANYLPQTRNEEMPQKTAPLKVMIVDDSKVIRLALKKILRPEFGFEIIAEAANPLEAEEHLKTLTPDLMTLDIHMPEMDGITYLEKLNSRGHRFPVVMISSINYEEAASAFRCFDLGAVDYIEKTNGLNLEGEADRIRAVLKSVRRTKTNSFTASYGTAKQINYRFPSHGRDLVLIGASTGGTEAIRSLFAQLPKECPPILIVQHIPAQFSATFAQRLNEIGSIRAKEAVNGEVLQPSTAYVAPGGKQMRLSRRGSDFVIEVNDDPAVNRHKPSVDYLFKSVAADRFADCNIVAALLTGMGADGALGLKELQTRGAHTIAQDEDSSVVFGMPKEAISLGAAAEVLPLPSIPYHVFSALKKRAA